MRLPSCSVGLSVSVGCGVAALTQSLGPEVSIWLQHPGVLWPMLVASQGGSNQELSAQPLLHIYFQVMLSYLNTYTKLKLKTSPYSDVN